MKGRQGERGRKREQETERGGGAEQSDIPISEKKNTEKDQSPAGGGVWQTETSTWDSEQIYHTDLPRRPCWETHRHVIALCVSQPPLLLFVCVCVVSVPRFLRWLQGRSLSNGVRRLQVAEAPFTGGRHVCDVIQTVVQWAAATRRP